ncbi:hypothetical protein DVH26_13525 [Paenibacillus sp. H1-7]|uniref:GDSL-type esterase/lipase family protein n=1 Tax=Paenibacillus sp. H1-7 TaxID=2282849 RepID=UPI001EF96F56|nr:GDSL-type esterase/lipase family protein [Paenibacillus sp. H1-7]ULL15369.1 hypothetical protein DVH26_13525 [Paenibacillus sp. H1-7]
MGTMFQKDAAVPSPLTVAFLGDSITDNGRYIAFMYAYFVQHMPDRELNFINLGVSSETASGLSEPEHPFPRPCVHDRIERALSESKPDWVVMCYGMNDGIYHPLSEDRFAAYRNGMMKLIGLVKQAGAKAIVVTPPPYDKLCKAAAGNNEDQAAEPAAEITYSWKQPYTEYNDVLKHYANWCLSLGDTVDAVVNIHDPLFADIQKARAESPDYRSGDGIHPNARGHWVMAKALLGRLFNVTLEQVPDHAKLPDSELPEWFALVMKRHRMLSAAWKEHVGHTNENKAEALPLDEAMRQAAELDKHIRRLAPETAGVAKTSQWKGHERTDFFVSGRECIVIAPDKAAAGRPWVWRTEFFDAFSYADMALLEQGWHIAYCRLSHMYGCPGAVELMDRFQAQVKERFGLAPKAALFGFSRGGLYAVQYAAAHPGSVLALYLDAPVLDIRSWPAGLGSGSGAPQQWEECLAVYGLNEQTAASFRGNPLDHAEALVRAGIPILVVAGDQDAAVPFSENGALLEERVKQLGGTIRTIVKPGVGHHPHSLEEPQPIVDFMKEAAAARL